jgi:drug/metabolite transporter (DMT)-like permease
MAAINPAATAGLTVTGIPTKTEDVSSGLGMFLLLSCVAIWGVNAVAFKVGTRGPYAFDAVMINGLRFLLVAPCFLVIIALKRPGALRVEHKSDLLRYAAYGFISVAASETLLTLSVRYTSVANMTLLGPGTISLFTAFWAVLLREQRLTRTGWVGAVVALLGVALVASAGGGLRIDPESLKGDALALFRSALQGGYMLLLTRTLRERPVLTVTVYNVLFGALAFLPYVIWKAPTIEWSRVPEPVWMALAWTVLPTTLYGFLAWNWSMRRTGAIAATNMMYLVPVFGALAAWAILKEPLHVGQIIGGVVIVGGIVTLRWDTMVSGGYTPRLPSLRLPWRNK